MQTGKGLMIVVWTLAFLTIGVNVYNVVQQVSTSQRAPLAAFAPAGLRR